MIKIINEYIKIDTLNTTLLLRINKEQIEKLYYGNKLKDDRDFKAFCYYDTEDLHASIDDTTTIKTIFSNSGDGNNRESFTLIVDKDNFFVNRFKFAKYVIIDNDDKLDNMPHSYNKKSTIKLTYFDDVKNIELNQYLSVFNDNDIISSKSEIINKTKENIYVKRLMSLQLDFHNTKTTIYTFDGAWARERHLNKTELTTGVFTIDSKSGFSSNTHNPFMIVENKNQGFVGFNLIYSGNHKEIVEKSPLGSTRVLTGLNDYQLSWTLGYNESFQSPEAIVVFGNNKRDITTQMHSFIKNHLVRKEFSKKLRPILINNWEATYFDFNKSKLTKLVDDAKELGIELFVLGDGWFGKRDNDDSSLGDWFDNQEKTGGLKNLSNYVKNKGMKFGIWVEPEMISFNSELYQKHPEYMMRIPNVSPIERRSQQMLDLVNED